jgi:hypothetical protein
VNYALDRHALLSRPGFLAGKKDDTILPPEADQHHRRRPPLPAWHAPSRPGA